MKKPGEKRLSFILIAFVLVCFGSVAQSDSGCHLFKIYTNFQVPYENSSTAKLLNEKVLLNSIEKFYGHSEFSKVFSNSSLSRKPLEQRLAYLNCVYSNVSRDTDGDGIGDWTAIVDHVASQMLIPLDDDIDGDGYQNIFDALPFKKSKFAAKKGIPHHLISTRAPKEQQILFDQWGILAIDHTDKLSKDVLEKFIRVLKVVAGQDRSAKHLASLFGIKLVYAFEGHDKTHDIGAYHHSLQAISFGGESAYFDPLNPQEETQLISALAHEVGHAFLLNQMTSQELSEVTEKFGGWRSLPVRGNLFSSEYFKPFQGRIDVQSFVSEYALKNRHEWFADAFASFLIAKMNLNTRDLSEKSLSAPLMAWLETRLRAVPSDRKILAETF